MDRSCLHVLGALLLVVSCGGVDPEQACLDLADTRADLAERCGLVYQAYYDGYLSSVANGSCGNIVEVRDEDELYQQCLPQLDDLTCEEFEADAFPPQCAEQLGR